MGTAWLRNASRPGWLGESKQYCALMASLTLASSNSFATRGYAVPCRGTTKGHPCSACCRSFLASPPVREAVIALATLFVWVRPNPGVVNTTSDVRRQFEKVFLHFTGCGEDACCNGCMFVARLHACTVVWWAHPARNWMFPRSLHSLPGGSSQSRHILRALHVRGRKRPAT